eukprot:TRINITY_DN4989_c0_g1_i1.p1 TRINITY_DN4989_c0_g1~~TRINITY_DN4989_c0_g1_i1.p1  ORF type:complete len:157 (+),score=27.98 TRINITY_DN4989_c0_g1_i1:900-1370(+)
MMVLEGLHRVPIIDRTGNITGIVTESMLIDFMWQNIEKFGDYFSKTKISDLIRCEMVYSTYEGTRAILAFRLMVTMNVSGLAVLDKDNHLVDNLSLRDLKVRVDCGWEWLGWLGRVGNGWGGFVVFMFLSNVNFIDLEDPSRCFNVLEFVGKCQKL